MGRKPIQIRNAKVNNLKDVNIDIEYRSLTVFVGPSGSGKSSLAFDVLYAAAAFEGTASGVLKFFRKSGSDFKVSGLPTRTIGIEQQLYSDSEIENIGNFTGFSAEVINNISKVNPSNIVNCHICHGKGYLKDIDPSRIVKKSNYAVTNGVFTPAVKKLAGLNTQTWRRFCSKYLCNPSLEWSKINEEIRIKILFEGTEYFKGIIPSLQEYLAHPYSSKSLKDLEEEIPYYLKKHACGTCKGKGVIGNLGDDVKGELDDLIQRGLINFDSDELKWLKLLKLEKLNLFDPVFGLSGSEMRNLRLFLSLRGPKKNSLIIIDEPTAGLLPTEAEKIIEILQDVKEKGHAVVVVEHRTEVIAAADKVVAFGPESGSRGGKIVFEGKAKEYFIKKAPKLNQMQCRYPNVFKDSRTKRPNEPKFLIGQFSQWHNFVNFEVNIPMERWTCICGPIGSGKTSYLDAAYAICDKTPVAWQGRSKLIERKNHDAIRRPHMVTPDPIGQHPGSTPATYIGLWSKIRDLFAGLPEAKKHKLTESHFSFNTKQGQCGKCKGQGFEKTEHGYEVCPGCHGSRYRQHILRCLYHGQSIADINKMDVRQAEGFFKETAAVCYYLDWLSDLMLEYLILGQPSNSLSGGESQRVKLTVELCKKYGNRALYLLDNPFRGIGDSAVSILADILRQLTARKNTVVIAENNPAIAKKADWLVFLGERKGNALTIMYEGPGSQCPDNVWKMYF